jgi:hypothetical protein
MTSIEAGIEIDLSYPQTEIFISAIAITLQTPSNGTRPQAIISTSCFTQNRNRPWNAIITEFSGHYPEVARWKRK